jgi:hypothetical protein
MRNINMAKKIRENDQFPLSNFMSDVNQIVGNGWYKQMTLSTRLPTMCGQTKRQNGHQTEIGAETTKLWVYLLVLISPNFIYRQIKFGWMRISSIDPCILGYRAHWFHRAYTDELTDWTSAKILLHPHSNLACCCNFLIFFLDGEALIMLIEN